ncbi:MAG TPA: hypothetical protein VJO16_01895 [Candidatus Acidoferrum sp.]|nr:hypothetical protein [Candidatus Acidoferrum sp.]
MQFFLKKYNSAYGKNIFGLTRRAQTVLLRHAWPRNVRELENVISSACITATGEFIDLADLPGQLQHREGHSLEGDDWKPLALGRSAQGAHPASVEDVPGQPANSWESGGPACIAT